MQPCICGMYKTFSNDMNGLEVKKFRYHLNRPLEEGQRWSDSLHYQLTLPTLYDRFYTSVFYVLKLLFFFRCYFQSFHADDPKDPDHLSGLVNIIEPPQI